MSVERISSVGDFERCLEDSAAHPVFVLKHSTT